MANKITVLRGDTKTITVTITDSNGDAYDLTNKTVFFTVKNDLNENDDYALIKKSFTSGDATGIATFNLTNTDTEISAKTYSYNVRLVNSGETTVLSTDNGTFEIGIGATQRTS